MRTVISILLAVVFNLPTFADEIAELLGSVEKNNPELKALRENIKVSCYDLKSENSLDATSIEYSPFFQKGNSKVASSELIVSQEFDFPSLYYERGKAGKLQISALEKQYELSRRDIFQQTVDLYLGYVHNLKIKDYLEKRILVSNKIKELYLKKLEAGDATAIEINRIKLQLMELENSLILNETEREGILFALKELNGYTDLRNIPSEYPDWTIPEVFSKDQLSLDTEVKYADSKVTALKSEEKVAKQGWLPKLTIGYRRNTDFDEAVNGFIVGAAFPLFSNSNKVKAAKSRKAVAEIEADNARKKVENDLTKAYVELGMIAKALKTYDKSVVEECYSLLDKSLDSGIITLTDYYSQQTEFNGQMESFIDLQYEYYRKLCVLYRNTLTTDSDD